MIRLQNVHVSPICVTKTCFFDPLSRRKMKLSDPKIKFVLPVNFKTAIHLIDSILLLQ